MHPRLRVPAVAVITALTLSGAQAVASEPRNLVETAVAAGQFKTLVKAVEAAGLADTLTGPGPFTVFAPTDDAFSKLPEGALAGLLKNPDALRAVLLNHVVAGSVAAADVITLNSAKTALGQSVAINAKDGVRVENARVTKADIRASNGVIHVIDAVILPKNDVIEAARTAGSFKTLLTAIEAAGLTETLRGSGPFTVFAPNDEAFAKLPKETLDRLLTDKTKLAAILTYHVLPGKVPAGEIAKLKSAKTVQGASVTIDASAGVKVGEAKVIATDRPATNGVIHVIDTVLLPPDGT
ncbi:MAG: fasciclin domain-containing protein [Phycisphaerae bacterium]